MLSFYYVVEPLFFAKKNDLKLPIEIYPIVKLTKNNYYYFVIFESIGAVYSGLAGVGYLGVMVGFLLRIVCLYDMLINHLETVSERLKSAKASKKFTDIEEKAMFARIVIEHKNIFR